MTADENTSRSIVLADGRLLAERPSRADPGLVGCHASLWEKLGPSWRPWRRRKRIPRGARGWLCTRPAGHAGAHRWGIPLVGGPGLSEGGP